MNNLFTADPAGDETLGALAAAWQKNAAATQAAEARDARERASAEQQHRAIAEAAEAAREAAQRKQEWAEALRAINKLWARERAPDPRPMPLTHRARDASDEGREPAPEAAPPADQRDRDRDRDRDPINDPDPDDDGPRWDPRSRADGPRSWAKGRGGDPQKMWSRPPTFAERLASARADAAEVIAWEKAAAAAKTAKAAKVEHNGAGRVRELFTTGRRVTSALTGTALDMGLGAGKALNTSERGVEMTHNEARKRAPVPRPMLLAHRAWDASNEGEKRRRK